MDHQRNRSSIAINSHHLRFPTAFTPWPHCLNASFFPDDDDTDTLSKIQEQCSFDGAQISWQQQPYETIPFKS
jgi:hypothetical protein